MSNENTKPTRFYGQWDPHTDEVLWKNYFLGKTEGFFIECGAGDGITNSSCLLFEENFNWKGINIEASFPQFSRLVVNRPNAYQNFHVGLSDENGTSIFKSTGGGSGSLSHTPKQLEYLKSRGRSAQNIYINTFTFESLVDLFQLEVIDLFVLDVEGHELQVIEGMKDSAILPSVICVEYPMSGLNKITQKLTWLGYKFNFVSFNNAYFSRLEKEEWFGDTSI